MSTETSKKTNILTKHGAYWQINKSFARYAGIEAAIVLADLIAKDTYFSKKGLLTKYGFCYSNAQQIEKETTLKRDKQKSTFDKLKNLNLIKISLHGQPPRKYFKIQHENIAILLTSLDHKQLLSRIAFFQKKAENPAFVEHLKNLSYPDFLKTAYWKTIAKYVKQLQGNYCQYCETTRRLHVHHSTYTHHGDEINHLNDLLVLCKECHNRVHNKIGEAE